MIRKIVAIGCILFGGALLYFGYESTQSVTGEINRVFFGRYSGETMAYLLLGGLLFLAGLLLAGSGKRRRSR